MCHRLLVFHPRLDYAYSKRNYAVLWGPCAHFRQQLNFVIQHLCRPMSLRPENRRCSQRHYIFWPQYPVACMVCFFKCQGPLGTEAHWERKHAPCASPMRTCQHDHAAPPPGQGTKARQRMHVVHDSQTRKHSAARGARLQRRSVLLQQQCTASCNLHSWAQPRSGGSAIRG